MNGTPVACSNFLLHPNYVPLLELPRPPSPSTAPPSPLLQKPIWELG
jgi:hypothetical protein